MGVLQRFERKLGGMVEGAFAKVFKDQVHPVEIAGALAREADQQKAITPNRVLVPNEYTVELGPSDYERLSPYADPLGTELSAMVGEHAQAQQYSFVGPVTVAFQRSDELATGLFRIHSTVLAASSDEAAPVARAAAVPPPLMTPPPLAGAVLSPVPPAAPISTPDPEFPSARVPGPSVPYGHTTALPATAAPAAQATLVISMPGQPDRKVGLEDRTITLGRGTDSDLTLADTSVSRRHGEISWVDGAHRYRDLASTNGSLLNGRPIAEADLTDGDRIGLGTASVTYLRPGN